LTAPIKILQITDLHLLARADARLLGVDTADSLRAVLASAFAEDQPDALLATGDITHHGEAAAYARFESIVGEFHQGPRLVIPGNHDLSAPMSRYSGEHSRLRFPGWEIIGIDSHIDDQVGAARIDPESLRAQCRAASAAGRRIVLAVHHPPVTVNCPWLDKDRIQNADELLEWLAGESTVAAVVFGHIHQHVEGDHRHIRLLGTPATCFQFQPDSESFAIDLHGVSAMPGYRWLWLDPDGGLTSEVRRVDDYPLQIELPPPRR
jgi:3',5'-cyclic-AMP phosphodiesterase